MIDKFIIIKGKVAGPKSMVLAGVHGNEVCGIKALQKIIPKIKIDCGQVIFGFGNPRAIRKNIRQTAENLNRMFKSVSEYSKKQKQSYEYKRAQLLKKYFDKVEVLLDLHASFAPNDRPFVICKKKDQEFAKFLPLKTVVFGFDAIEPGGTDYYMNQKGKVGFCVECGYFTDNKAVKVAEKTILNFLKARGHLKSNLKKEKQKYLQVNYLYYTKTNKFVLKKEFADFEKIKKGQLIGFDGTKKVLSPQTGFILFSTNREKKGSEGFLLGK
ncbi:MAG: succinylglutamate desuccinylase/aspartoacylase family protein [Patescibacteria group bacterium]